MPGAFGLLSDPNPSHFPANRLVEANARVSITAIFRAGLREGNTAKLQWAGKHSQLAIREGKIWIGDTAIALAYTDDGRVFWRCPCGRRSRFIYLATLRCRQCSGFDWSCRHQNRTLPPALRKVRKLRAKLGGCDLAPFAPLRVRVRNGIGGRSRAQHEKLVAMILDAEAVLVEHLAGINRDLARRARLRGMIPK
jgi:hypothetical protein